MTDMKQRARNAMVGLAIGDAISWTSMFQRSFLLPPWTRRIRREIDTSSEATNVIVTPMPFSLNQPAQHFDISPTMNTEWSAFSAEILVGNGFSSYTQSVLKAWMDLAQSKDTIRGGVSTQAAIHNLRKGILPPQSGKENPHYFDDGAMARAVPIGIICAGEPEKAARMVEIDASVTNSEDGVWAAQAIAVALSMLCTGTNIDEAISSADQYLPKSSWIRRVVEEARKISEKSDTLFSILPDLQKGIVNREYSYGNVAPETLALAFVIVRLSSNNFGNAVTAACGFAKSGMTMPSIVGALMGGMQSTPFASESWLSVIKTLKGISIPSFAGKDYLSLVEQISNLAGEKVVQ